MARHVPLPSVLSTKRSRVITIAIAGTLTLATAISAAATLPSGFSPVPASADAAYLTTIGQQAGARSATDGTQQVDIFNRMRFLQGEHVHQIEVARAAVANAAARKTAEAKAAQTAPSPQATTSAPSTQQSQPVAQSSVTVPSGAPEQIAEQMLGQYGWSSGQFSCLQPLWAQESGWNVSAENPTTGAFGIPQALPGSEMSSAGADWQTNAATQIRWGLTYIQGRYGSPCGAWGHEQADGWY